MNKILKIVCVCLLFTIIEPFSAFADAGFANDSSVEKTSNNYDWNNVINAIIQVESQGNSRAKSGNSVGAMQITPVLVLQCNQILKRRKSKKRYKLSDRFSIQKSKEMFLLMQAFYNPMNNVEQAIRSWNGGMHYSITRTQRYFEKVMSYIK